jgi:hypothetical protein
MGMPEIFVITSFDGLRHQNLAFLVMGQVLVNPRTGELMAANFVKNLMP